jgi:hypothetical protein
MEIAPPSQYQSHASTGNIYTSVFPVAEIPLSEGGKWVSGRITGLDWADVAILPGLAYGIESGTRLGKGAYDDSTVLLTGIWGSDQAAEATAHTINQNEAMSQEVELRLRSSLSAHTATGYEINFRCLKTDSAYPEITRWNGPLGDFKYLARQRGLRYGVANGDIVKATVIGNVITAYINGVRVLQAVDDTYVNGNPGMGFFLRGDSIVNRDYGFIRFTASDNNKSDGSTSFF